MEILSERDILLMPKYLNPSTFLTETATALVASSVKSPDLSSLKEVQWCWQQFDFRSQHKCWPCYLCECEAKQMCADIRADWASSKKTSLQRFAYRQSYTMSLLVAKILGNLAEVTRTTSVVTRNITKKLKIQYSTIGKHLVQSLRWATGTTL